MLASYLKDDNTNKTSKKGSLLCAGKLIRESKEARPPQILFAPAYSVSIERPPLSTSSKERLALERYANVLSRRRGPY